MNPTFNLPDKNNHTGRVIGNGMVLGLNNGTKNYGLSSGSGNSSGQYLMGADSDYGKNVGTARTGSATTNAINIGITTDPTKSGMIVETDADLVVCIKF